MSKFDPEFYRRFRPYYPPEVFYQFSKRLKDHGFTEPFLIADIGCGTGHSAISLLRTGMLAKIVGVDPDLHMLDQAKLLTANAGYSADFQLGSGENSNLKHRSCDAVLIGSAFHWMDPKRTQEEIARILKPRGLIRIMEYQFPKATNHPHLNEWIRRQFNLFWKAPGQKPRGSFLELMTGFRSDPRFTFSGSGTPKMIQSLSTKDLLGHLWSQSRVLCYLQTITETERIHHYNEVQKKLEELFQDSTLSFDFKLQWIEFTVN